MSFPEKLESLSEVEREDCTIRMAERWRHDEDNGFFAFEGPGELERQLVDDYEASEFTLPTTCACANALSQVHHFTTLTIK